MKVVLRILMVMLAAAPAAAQTPRAGTLQVTVTDQTNAVIAGATVTITGTDAATRSVTEKVQTSDQGVASVPRLPPGLYSIQAEFPGFETRTLQQVRIRAGDNKQTVLLPIAGLQDAVTVEENKQQAATDPHGPTFGSTLTREQIDALSDDPEVLQKQLQDMAGPGAVLRIDSFEGGELPPKAMIRSIRISRDQFAAENHSAGGISIDIVTQPGLGPIRYNTQFRFRDGSMSGSNPFASTTPPEQIRNYRFGLGGSLIKNKASFNLNVEGMSAYDSPVVTVAGPTGIRSDVLPIHTPRDNVNVYGQLDYALTLNQTLRIGYNQSRNTASNLGIGAYDLPERAYSNESTQHNVRAIHVSPLGRRALLRTRGQVTWLDTASHSLIEEPTIRVNDAFTRGGAQVAGGQHTRTFNMASDLDYVRGIHTLRTGLQLDVAHVRADDATNYLGTYTFESLDEFNAGTPRSYTRRIGDPNIKYANVSGAWYLQDDARVRQNLTLSAGLRYEAQTHVADYNNVAPRFGVTWAPAKSGATALRASWGIFYDWLPASTYEQTLRVDGHRQQEINILDPSYPVVIEPGEAPPVARYLLSDGLRLPHNSRVSVGIDQRISSRFQANATYSYVRGASVLRGFNENAPIAGVRPDPSFGNVIEVMSDASSRQRLLQTSVTANPTTLLPAYSAARVDWRRVGVTANYTLGFLENNTDGPFATPANLTLLGEWGPAGQDIRHRGNVTVNNQIVRNLLMQVNFNAASAPPYTIRTGRDDNGDLIFNDRPIGVGRNSARGSGQWTINPAAAYTFIFGRRVTSLPPGIAVVAAGGGAPIVQTVDQSGGRFRLQLVVQIQNLTNHANYAGYSGTLTSPLFGQPTTVLGTRKIDMGVNLSF
jgi:hypothetical protein